MPVIIKIKSWPVIITSKMEIFSSHLPVNSILEAGVLGIKYIHFPELGIASDKRIVLNTRNDYDRLFRDYEENTLRTEETVLEKLYQILLSNKRIALTCFEADHNYCHRSKTAKALSVKFENNYNIKHI